MDPMMARIIVTTRHQQLQAEAANARLAEGARKRRRVVLSSPASTEASPARLRQAFLLLAQHHA